MLKIETWAIEKLVRDDSALHDYQPGETIFRQGDPGSFMAVVLRGSVNIQRNGQFVAEIESGSIIGEMALIDGKPRSGDAVAKTHCRLACIDEPHFRNLIREVPEFALTIMKILVERLRLHLEN